MSRPTCDHSWESDGQTVHCQRWAVVTIDVSMFKTKAYCEEHVSSETDISQYR